MNWSKQISIWELVFIASFLLIYLFYFFRTFRIGKQLGTASKTILMKFFLRSSYMLLMIIALLGPSFGITETEARSTAKDIYVALDLSSSMNTADVSPSRLDRVKFELRYLLEQLKTNRFGLIVFSSQAYWQIPLTFDVGVVQEYISALNTDIMLNDGSNLNAPLELLHSKFEMDQNNFVTKTILLITDGENFSDLSLETITALRNANCQIILIGVGTESGDFVLEEGAPLTLSDGSHPTSILNKRALSMLATDLNASLFYINDELNQMPLVLNAINSSNAFELKERKLLVANNKFANFLLAALVLIVMDLLIPTKTFSI